MRLFAITRRWAWLMSFKRVVLVARTNPEQFGMNEVDVASLDSSIVIVEKLLFSSSFFSSILEQLAGTEQPDRFIKELAAVTLELIERASDRVNSDKERLSDKNTLLSSLCLTCLHSHLVPDITDRQLCTKAWEVHTQSSSPGDDDSLRLSRDDSGRSFVSRGSSLELRPCQKLLLRAIGKCLTLSTTRFRRSSSDSYHSQSVGSPSLRLYRRPQAVYL